MKMVVLVVWTIVTFCVTWARPDWPAWGWAIFALATVLLICFWLKHLLLAMLGSGR